jgi:Cd2+/Zn2+-exporting ATPase/Cu+-exporting ATPase
MRSGEPTHNLEYPQEEGERGVAVEPGDLVRIAVVAMCAIGSFFQLTPAFGSLDVVALCGVLVGVYPILKEALSALAERRMTMELSMVIAIVAACTVGSFLTAVVIVLFVLVAEVLEHLTISRGRRAIAELVNLLPQTATVRRDGNVTSVPVSTLRMDDTVVVKPGARLPIDGVVVAGHSFIDQSTVTGESMPAEKVVGSSVFAGTINQSGALDVRVERIGRDTAYGRIIESVEQAEHSRAPIQKTADRLAAYLVYFALGSAVLTFLLTQ